MVSPPPTVDSKKLPTVVMLPLEGTAASVVPPVVSSFPAIRTVPLGGDGGAFLVEVVLLRGGELGESMVGAHRRNYARKAVTELVAAISARDILPCNVTATLCLRARGFGVHTRSSTGVNW